MASRPATSMSAHADASTHETTTAVAPPAKTPPEAPADGASVDLAAPASAPAGAERDRGSERGPEPERDPEANPGEEGKPAVDLARMAWLATVLACLVAVGVLILQGYFGYAGVTFAVAVSAATNLL